jgi:hypothetical protein
MAASRPRIAAPASAIYGAATVEITVQGTGSYDIRRAESSKRFDSIADAHRGDRGYVAVSDTQAEA